MTDVFTAKKRSEVMSKIRAKTILERQFFKILRSKGLKFKTHVSKLPGKPDIVFPKQKIIVFVDGCFWHKCPEHFNVPATRTDFWMHKIRNNMQRDKIVNKLLKEDEWKVLRFWEHEIEKYSNKLAGRIYAAVKQRA